MLLLYKFDIFVIVKKIISIFLVLQIISNNGFAEELIKIPGLITHYYHHSQEHKDTKDFFDFLHKHYSDHHKGDRHADGKHAEDEDCNLPFKHCGSCCLNLHSSVIGFVPICLNTNYIFFQDKNTIFLTENDRIESSNISSIWQPPKI